MTETKFILHGRFHRKYGYVMNDSLSYIKETEKEAILTCNRLNPNFEILSITVEEAN